MIAILAGICIKSEGKICPAGSTIVEPIVALVGGFVAVGLIGIIWLAIRGRRGV
jgi:hypothetical protein